MSIRSKTFPGVYASVRDGSFQANLQSRFNAGLIGPAEKGPLNKATKIKSLKEFRRVFGKSLSKSYLANAAAIVADISDGSYVVRVGREFEEIGGVVTPVGSGNASGTFELTTNITTAFAPNEYVRVRQRGKKTTIAKVGQVVDHDGEPGTDAVLSAYTEAAPTVLLLAEALADGYTAGTAVVDRCPVAGGCNEAESFLYGQTLVEVVASSPCRLTGTKNSFKLTIELGTTSDKSALRTALNTAIASGETFTLSESGKVSTLEFRIKEVRVDNTVILENTNLSRNGYQAISLQDTYGTYDEDGVLTDGATIKKHSGTRQKVAHLKAASPGTWANTEGSKGLKVYVGPGTNPGTKKFLVYEDSGLVETIDNLEANPKLADNVTDNPNYYANRINGKSESITIDVLVDEHPVSSVEGWDSTVTTVNVATFEGGLNGEDVIDSNYIGEIDPVTEEGKGLKIFEDTDNIDIDVLWTSPIGVDSGTSIAVAQELAAVATKANAIGYIDVPRKDNGQLVSARLAVDWHNGTGLFAGRGKLDNYRLACFWNWFTTTDPFTHLSRDIPASIGALRCLAYTFDRYKPWLAAAGEKRGLIPEATGVTFTKISEDAKHGMYGEGNSVNPIIVNRGSIMLFGERTMQRAESKLTAIHSVVVTNEIIKRMSAIARGVIFDPNDPELLLRLELSFRTELEKIKNEQGLEDYHLVMDKNNNTAETRNRREVIVDLDYIPTDCVERVFLNATTRESGAVLNSVR